MKLLALLNAFLCGVTLMACIWSLRDHEHTIAACMGLLCVVSGLAAVAYTVISLK